MPVYDLNGNALVADSTTKGNALIPIYIGDYLAYSRSLQSMCVVGDKVYTANVFGHDKMAELQTDTGVLRVFDMTNNCELPLLSKEIPAGHANDMCYDYSTENFYIAAEFTYTEGSQQNANWLFKFDNNFDYIEKVSTPTLAQGVSYDPIEEQLYYYGWSGTIYKWNGSAFEKLCDVDLSDVKPSLTTSRYNQSFAVYDGRFYLTAANNNFISGKITPNVSHADASYVILNMESRSRFRLGETQGMEFAPDGHLFAGNAVQLIGDSTNDFIVELPVGTCVPYATNLRGNYDGYTQGELSLSDDALSAFALSTSQIRSLAQLYSLSPPKMVTSVWIPAGSNIIEDAVIRISQDMMLKIGGKYTCQQFQIYGGHLNIEPMDDRTGDDWHITITTDGYPFDLTRAGRLSMTGVHSCRFNLPNRATRSNFVYAASYKSLFVTSYRPTCVQPLGTLQCAGVNIGYDTIQIGGTSIPESYKNIQKAYTENSYVLAAGFNCGLQYTHGYAPAMLIIDIVLNQALPQNTDVQIGEFICTLERPLVYNVSSTLSGATLQVTIGTLGEVVIRTAGNTTAGDSYKTVAGCYIANDNR